MNIRPGQLLLHYRVVEKIGEGGMSVVWKALDTELDREVAIKVLPEAVFADDARMGRFEREARLLASLSHPNIAIIHGLHRTAGGDAPVGRFLAMELLPGEDLAHRLARGSLPLDDALRVARDVAAALEAAHERGVIHRDLKPANIQVLPHGGIKVLDFGLAKAFERDPGAADPSMSPTLSSLGTVAGTILGTAAYMSPEQAKGREVDKRADVWAFGAVLFETLAGRAAFLQPSIPETLAAVLKEEPDWSLLPGNTPPAVRTLLRRCLAKDPRSRLRDLGDARLVIEEVLAGELDDEDRAADPPPASRTSRWRSIAPWAVALALGGALAWTGIGRDPTDGPARPGARLSVALDPAEEAFLANLDLEIMPEFVLSPGGERLVYASLDVDAPSSRHFGGRRLLTRSLDRYPPEVLSGSEAADSPFFSPDGAWIGFFDGTRLLKIPASGGARLTIVEGIGHGTGATWAEDDTIVFAHSYVGPLYTVSASGGEPRALTTLGPEETSHRFPQRLPDGASILFTIKPKGILTFDDALIGIADRATGEHRVLPVRGTYARYVDSGHLLFGRAGNLYAAPFDLDRLEIAGGAVPVVEGLVTNPTTGAVLMDVSDDGTLAYVRGEFRSGPSRLVRIRSDGSRADLGDGAYGVAPRLSPDGTRLVLHGPAANDTVLVLDLERGTTLRMTEPDANAVLPIWGPGGRSILYSSDRSGSEEIVSIPAGGGPAEVVVPACGVSQDAYDVTADGRRLAMNRGSRSSRDIWVWDRDRSDAPEPFLVTAFNEGDPVFSPDGAWIAYTSDESGTGQIYLAPYPGPGGRIQVSAGDGAFYPAWRADGRAIYYQDRSAIYEVPIAWTPTPRPGRPRKLHDAAVRYPLGFAVNADGSEFYVVEFDESFWRTDRIDVVLGWTDELGDLPSAGL